MDDDRGGKHRTVEVEDPDVPEDNEAGNMQEMPFSNGTSVDDEAPEVLMLGQRCPERPPAHPGSSGVRAVLSCACLGSGLGTRASRQMGSGPRMRRSYYRCHVGSLGPALSRQSLAYAPPG